MKIIDNLNKLEKYLIEEADINLDDFQKIIHFTNKIRNEALAINPSSPQLKGKQTVTFDEWLEFHYYKTDKKNVYRIGRDLFNKEDLFKQYNKVKHTL